MINLRFGSQLGRINRAGSFPEEIVRLTEHLTSFRAIFEVDSNSRVPPLQLAQGESVIGMQEVMNRVLFTACSAIPRGLCPCQSSGSVLG